MAPKTAAEARQLLSDVEKKISYATHEDEIIETSKEIVDFFKKSKDNRGLATALHSLVASNIAKVEKIRKKSGRNAAPIAPILEDMDSTVNANLKEFRGAGDKYGEAYMLLSLAHLGALSISTDKLKEALDNAATGSKIAVELGEKDLEAKFEYASSMLHLQLKDVASTVSVAKKGLELCEKLGDKELMTKLYTAIAAAYEIPDLWVDVLDARKKALAITKELDDKRLIISQVRAVTDCLVRVGQFKEALPFAKEALTLCQSLGQEVPEHEVEARRLIMGIHSLRGDMTASLKMASETVKVFQERELKTELILAYDGLCHMLLRKTDGEAGLQAAEAGLEIAREIGEKRLEADILKTIGATLGNMGQDKEAEQKMKESQEILREMGEAEDEGNAIHDLCMHHISKLDYETAFQLAQEELSLAQDTKSKQGEANALVSLGLASSGKQEKDEAIRYGNEALDMFSELNDPRGQAMAHTVVAQAYLHAQEFEEAVKSAESMLEVYKDIGCVPGQADAYKFISDIYTAQELTEEALAAATSAVQLAKKKENKRTEITMLMNLANTQLNQIHAEAERSKDKRLRGAAKALKPAKEARALAKKLGDRNLLGNAVKTLAQIQGSLGRLDEGLKSALAAASIFRETCEPGNEMLAILSCGEIMHAQGDQDKAMETVMRAYDMAEKADDKYGMHMASQVLEIVTPKQAAAGPVAAAGPSDAGQTSEAAATGPALKAGLDPEFVKKFVHETVLAVVGGDDDSIMWDSPLMDSGMDSLSSVQFRNELQRQAGFNLPAAMIFDYPTQAQIADHLVEQSRMQK